MKPVHTLDEILGNAIKIKVLRELITHREAKTGRALAKIISVSPPAVLKPLQELVNQGIFIKQIVGKSHLYHLNKNNILASKGLIPLFQLEAALFSELAKILEKELPYKVDSAILFGSVTRGRATHESDWDLLLLCDRENIVKKLLEELPLRKTEWGNPFSCNLDIQVMTIRDFKKKFSSGDAFAQNVYQDYVKSQIQNPLFGKSLLEILRK